MRRVRSAIALLSLLLLSVMAPALAATAEEVTLQSGEVVLVTAEGNEITFTLPSGMELIRTISGNASSLAGPMEMTDADMRKADEAYAIWQQIHPPKDERSIPAWAALFIVGIGVLHLGFPRQAWYMREGWRLKQVEPSDAMLVVNRILGAMAVVFGLVLLFVG